MKTISKSELSGYINRQVEYFFPDKRPTRNTIEDNLTFALERVEYCFSKISNKYYYDNDRVVFNYLHTDQYAAFLYYLANTIWQNTGDENTAGKVYALNKALHGLDVFYEVHLPDVFLFTHPVGTVLGRAKYSNYLIISQGVTIGGNKELIYPKIGEGTYLFSNCSIVGRCIIGENNLIAIGTIVRQADTPDNVIVYNVNGEVRTKKAEWSVKSRFFRN